MYAIRSYYDGGGGLKGNTPGGVDPRAGLAPEQVGYPAGAGGAGIPDARRPHRSFARSPGLAETRERRNNFV